MNDGRTPCSRRRTRSRTVCCGQVVLGLALAGLLAGCRAAPTIVDKVVDAAIMSAKDRSFYTIAEDYAIKLDIVHTFLDENMLLAVNTDVYEGKVMLTGSVSEPESRRRAEAVAHRPPGVRQVVNEIQVTNGNGGGVVALAGDLMIETLVFGRLLAAEGVSSIDYLWRSVNGVVYLIGMAQSQEEHERVLEIARRTVGVRNVVSHIYVRTPGDPRGSFAKQ